MAETTQPAWSVTGYRGTVTVQAGDRFSFDGDTAVWEVVCPTGEVTYSPSGIGGCAVLACRLVLGEPRRGMEKYVHNGMCDFCGDSIATAILWAQRTVVSA